MTQEIKKKQQYGRQTKDESSNVHVLPLDRINQSNEHIPFEPHNSDFASFAQNLEKRICQIELNLKESLQALENDIHQSLKKNKLQVDKKDVEKDLNDLSLILENRIQNTLNILTSRQENQKERRSQIALIKELSSKVIKALSLDFYKGVVNRLGSAEYQEEVDPFGMDKHFVEKIKPLFDFLYYKYWRVTTTGLENISDEGRSLIVSNHSGTVPYDGSMIKTAILNEHPKRKDVRFLVEDFVYHMPMLGSFMYRTGGVRACQENAEYLLKSEHLVVVFPEGVKGIGKYYNNRYKLQRFGRGGFIKLCMKTKSPLIPVGVVGAEEIHPIIHKSNILAKTIGLPYIPITPTFPLLGLLGCIPLPTKWFIHFGKPINFESYGAKAIQDELLVHKLSEKVRGDIQEIIKNLLQKRRSIFGG